MAASHPFLQEGFYPENSIGLEVFRALVSALWHINHRIAGWKGPKRSSSSERELVCNPLRHLKKGPKDTSTTAYW